jgi:alanine-glyoxylate transaminase/serine-glyoxylate transaminase/serine-pyruvate transaminase
LASSSFPELQPSARVLLGPGPSNIHPRVMKAMLSPMVGHLDPDFIRVMDDIKKMLRVAFRTANEITFPVSGTGSAGMQTVMANLIEAGDEVVIGTAGVFGTRMVEVATRLGARIHRVDAEWGKIVEPALMEKAIKAAKSPKLVAIVHAETSTGIDQPIEEISKMAHAHGRRSDVARMLAAGDRRLANRRLLQLHAKGYRRAAGAVTGDLQRACDGSRAQAQDAVHLVVLRSFPD